MSDAEEETNQSVSAPTGNQRHRISLVFFETLVTPHSEFSTRMSTCTPFPSFLKLRDVSVAKISSGQDQQTFSRVFGANKTQKYTRNNPECARPRGEKCLTCTSQTKLQLNFTTCWIWKWFVHKFRIYHIWCFSNWKVKKTIIFKIEGWIFYFLVCFHLDSVLSVVFLRRH